MLEDGKKKVLGIKEFPYDLGGVRTGQKIQGATTPRLTCNFNPRPKGVRTNLNHRSVFVSISRVKSIEHFRIIPLIDGDRSKLEYMKNFSMDPKLRILPMCYNENGEWAATTDDIIRWFDDHEIVWRPKGTNKHPLTQRELEILRLYPKLPSREDSSAVEKVPEDIQSNHTQSSVLDSSNHVGPIAGAELDDMDPAHRLNLSTKRPDIGSFASPQSQSKKKKTFRAIQRAAPNELVGKKRKNCEITTSIHSRHASSPMNQSTQQTPCHGIGSSQLGERINFRLDDFDES